MAPFPDIDIRITDNQSPRLPMKKAWWTKLLTFFLRLHPIDLWHAGSDAAKGFAAIQGELESVAAKGFCFYWGRERMIPNRAAGRRKDAQNIEISLLFQRPKSGEVRFVSTLFDRLPLGHRQFLSAQTTTGVDLGQALLSAFRSEQAVCCTV